MNSKRTPLTRLSEFSWPVRVYYEDTDAAGIVYHANYLRFMERARTEWLRELGFEQDELRESSGVLFVIARSEIQFVLPARFNASLVVHSRLESARRVSLCMKQSIVDAESREVCAAINTIACVHAETLRPCRIPAHMMRTFEGA